MNIDRDKLEDSDFEMLGEQIKEGYTSGQFEGTNGTVTWAIDYINVLD